VHQGRKARTALVGTTGRSRKASGDGKVVFVRDGLPDQTPGADLLEPEGPLDFGGNQVVVRMGRGVYAQYYHLQPGSISVRKGERVKTGQLLGKLGNTGNSFSPHRHFDLTTGPNVFTSDSLPYVFDRYRWAGSADLEKSTETDLVIRGKHHQEIKSHPLFPSLVDFQ
jgi:murein DD-endopeptidase MepM/ murein hydrolase activator NlpD